MDPLSITASCIAIAGAGGAVIKGMKKLRDLTMLPDILLSIIDEVADLSLVLQGIRLNFQIQQDPSGITQAKIAVLHQLLDHAQNQLLKLDQIINYRLIRSNSNGQLAFSRSAWILEKPHVQQLQASLRATRLDIVADFASLNLYDIHSSYTSIQLISVYQYQSASTRG